jgi:hypothetical protein
LHCAADRGADEPFHEPLGRGVDRRSFLTRAVAGAGALAAGGLVLPAWASAAAPPFETLGTGEDRPTPRILERAKATPAAKPAAPKTQAEYPVPPIVTRAQWGADETLRDGVRSFVPIRKIVVHHTASPSNPKDPVAVLNKMYEWSITERGYSDLGYNFVIDHKGRIYEGRWARPYGPKELHDGEDADGWGVLGAHAKGVNAGSCGIVLIGDFTQSQPTQAALSALVELVAWKASRHRIDPLRSETYLSLFGQRRTFANIGPHRDVGNTICPGSVNDYLPAVRAEVAKRVGRFPALTIDPSRMIRYRRWATPAPTAGGAATAPAAGGAVTAPTGQGLRLLTADGRVLGVGLPSGGSPRDYGRSDSLAIAAAATTGYWVLDRRGGVLAFGGTRWYGSPAHLGKRVSPADIAARPAGDGYWVLTTDGNVLGFGAARHFGSPQKDGATVPSARLRPTPSGKGYWVLMADGRIRPFGDANLLPASLLARTGVVDLIPTPSGAGAWLLFRDGRVLAVGDAPYRGDLRGTSGWSKAAAALVGATDGKGYTIVDSAGRSFRYGSAPAFPAAGANSVVIGACRARRA